jgi:hypothetical protein
VWWRHLLRCYSHTHPEHRKGQRLEGGTAGRSSDSRVLRLQSEGGSSPAAVAPAGRGCRWLVLSLKSDVWLTVPGNRSHCSCYSESGR